MLNLGAYRRVLSLPGLAGFLWRGLPLRVPNIATPIVLALYTATREHDVSFGAAGLVVALWTAGLAVGSPLQGWLIDRRGLRLILFAATLVQAGFWGCVLVMPFPVLAVTAFISGLFVVSCGTITRLAISAIVPEGSRHTAFSVNSMLTDFSAMVVPPVAVVVITQAGTSAAVLGVGAVSVVSCALLVGKELPSGHQPAGRAFRGVRSVLNVKLITTFVCVAAVGVMTSGSDVALLATLRSVGQTGWAGAVLAVCAASSLLGGLIYGSRSRGLPPAPVVAAVGLFMIPLGIWADWRWMIVAFVPAALLVSSAYCAAADAASKLADPHVRATVMSIYGTALTAGMSLGPPLAGVAYDLGSHQVSFLVIGGVGIVAGLLAWRPLRDLTSAGGAESIRTTVPVGSPTATEPT